MKKNVRRLLLGSVAALAAVALAHAAGIFPNFPIVGGASYSAGQGVVVPAGPALTGNELIPADTNLANGQAPQTVLIPSATFNNAGWKNRIIGGDFATNLWQRYIAATYAAITPTAAAVFMPANNWWTYSSGNTATITKQTAAADTIPSQGLYASMRVNRPSGTNTTSICIGQTMDQKQAAPLVGNNAVLSFWAMAPSTYLQTNQTITATISAFTSADSLTGGTNVGLSSLGTLTNQTAQTAGTSSGFPAGVLNVGTGLTPVAGTAATGTVTIPLTATWTRYSVYGFIPTTYTTSATATTGVAVSICTGAYPASTGVAGDYFEIEGVQLEAAPAGGVTPVTSPTLFERRPASVEALMQGYYAQGPGVEVAGGVYDFFGNCVSSTNMVMNFAFTTPMRTPPLVGATSISTGGTVAGASNLLVSGGYKINTAAAQTAVGTMTVNNSTTSLSTTTTGVVFSPAACTTTIPYNLVGTAATGIIVLSADP